MCVCVTETPYIEMLYIDLPLCSTLSSVKKSPHPHCIHFVVVVVNKQEYCFCWISSFSVIFLFLLLNDTLNTFDNNDR